MSFLRTELAALTDTGQERPHNEDAYTYFEPGAEHEKVGYGRLYIVADGVGGGGAGEIASRFAAEKVLHDYYHHPAPEPQERLLAAIEAVNSAIFEYWETHDKVWRMGTTLVAALLLGDRLLIANVGDSRAYLLASKGIVRLTKDHTLVAELEAEGVISADEAQAHPRRNVLLRALGYEAEIQPDFFECAFQPGEMLLLCTDGLTRHVSDAGIKMMTTGNNPAKAARVLVFLANMRGGEDNITLLLLAAVERLETAYPIEDGGEIPPDLSIEQLMVEKAGGAGK